jgi:hypothetical protein
MLIIELMMMNWSKYLIDIDLLLNNKENLLRFSNYLNEAAVKTIYANYKTDTEDYKMSDHMADRFKSFSSDPACFFSGTPCIQSFLNSKCQLHMDATTGYIVMEFFKYIKYGLGLYDIENMFGDDKINMWKELNSINFFFELTIDMQLALIKKYNAIYDNLL